MGKKNQPFFRIIVTEKRSPPRGGRPLEILGFYNPLTKEKKFKKQRIEYWLSVGAQPSDTVYNMLVNQGILKGKKRKSHKKAKKKKQEKSIEAPKQVKQKPADEKAKEVEKVKEPAKEKKEKPAEKEIKKQEPAKEQEPAKKPKS